MCKPASAWRLAAPGCLWPLPMLTWGLVKCYGAAACLGRIISRIVFSALFCSNIAATLHLLHSHTLEDHEWNTRHSNNRLEMKRGARFPTPGRNQQAVRKRHWNSFRKMRMRLRKDYAGSVAGLISESTQKNAQISMDSAISFMEDHQARPVKIAPFARKLPPCSLPKIGFATPMRHLVLVRA